jgi:hypothetical protein
MDQKLRLEWMDPSTLKPNPMNWREHPEQQKRILAAVLHDVGWAGALLLNERTGNLIDGHARREHAIDDGSLVVPVLVGDWSIEDEQKILATLDPLASMADQIDSVYQDLLESFETSDESLGDWCKQLLADINEATSTSLGDVPELGGNIGDDVKLEQCPKCGFEWKKS